MQCNGSQPIMDALDMSFIFDKWKLNVLVGCLWLWSGTSSSFIRNNLPGSNGTTATSPVTSKSATEQGKDQCWAQVFSVTFWVFRWPWPSEDQKQSHLHGAKEDWAEKASEPATLWQVPALGVPCHPPVIWFSWGWNHVTRHIGRYYWKVRV